MNKKYT